MEYERKRLLSFIIVGGYLFLGGCEYAVILPTCLSYLKSLGATEEYWLGFTVSAYSFTAAASGIIGGRLSDMYEHHTKTIAMVSIVIMIFGSFQYTLGISVWNIVASRLICGCGTAAGSAMLAEVCRVTAIEERTPILAICNASRQLGILVGPIFQLILTYFSFNIGSLQVNPLNAPGIFMAGLWIIFSVMTYFMFYNLSTELKSMKWQQRGNHLVPVVKRAMTVANVDSNSRITSVSSSKSTPQLQPNSPHSVLSGEASPVIPADPGHSLGYQLTAHRAVSDCGLDSHGSNTSCTVDGSMTNSQLRKQRKMSYSERFLNSLAQSGYKSSSHIDLLSGSGKLYSSEGRRYLSEFLSHNFILMLSMVFTLFFCQVALETVVPVIMQDYFGYGEFENSLVYMCGGAEALIVFFSVAILSRYIRDTNLMTVGWAILIVAQIWLLVVLPWFQKESVGSSLDVTLFMIGLMMLYFGYAVSSVANTGLFSKCLSADTQGLGQGLRRMVSYMGLIFGPTWAGATIKTPYIFLGVSLAIVLLHAVMLIYSFNDLRKLERQNQDQDPSHLARDKLTISEEEESTPLLH